MIALKKIIKVIINILTFLVFGILIIIIFGKIKMIFSHDDNFEIFGYYLFNVDTGSMEPTIMHNDIIVVKKDADFSENDIVTFKKDKSYITHRVVRIRGNNVVTKGDANNTEDVAIKKEDVIGKVSKILPGFGIWQKIFTTPKIIVIVFITLMLFDLAFSYKGNKTKELLNTAKKLDKEMVIKINKQSDAPKLNNTEIKELSEKIDQIKNNETVELNNKEKKYLDYTIRLDLSAIQKGIEDRLNKED